MKSIGLLIFDLDGTLANTLEDITASVNYMLAQFGKRPIKKEVVRHYVGDGIEKLVERSLGGHLPQQAEALRLYKEHHHRNFLRHTVLYPQVIETLEYFKPIPKAVITNKSTEFTLPLLEYLGIRDYFLLVIGADAGLPLKPAPHAVLKIITDCKVPKEKAAIVGDGITDVLAGKAAGIITCAVTYGFRPEEELRAAGADFIIGQISGLKKLFTF